MGLKEYFLRLHKKNSVSLPVSLPGTPPESVSGPSSSRRWTLGKDLERVFRKFDSNGDGKISAEELRSAMSSPGGSPPSDEELRAMMAEADSDGDGFIDYEEFLALNTRDVSEEEVVKDLRRAFSVFDVDGNGKISAEELQMALRQLGEEASLAKCTEMVASVDRNGDGAVCFEEFKIMMIG